VFHVLQTVTGEVSVNQAFSRPDTGGQDTCEQDVRGQDVRGQDARPICDYEGSDYRTRFWENENRDYEDLAERIAIRHLLPPRGKRLLEIGTGFGRLVDLYQGYEQIVLLDYSKSMLREAQQRLGRSSRYTYVAADVYRMPLAEGLVDTACMVRVMHHMADVPKALAQIHRVIRPGGAFVLEFASKYHLKSIARYLARRQDWSPFAPEPVEFVPLNYDFHPRWMRARLEEGGFEIERARTTSHFRVPLLKRLVPARVLAAMDGAVQWTGQWWTLTPSVFVRARRGGDVTGRGIETGASGTSQHLDPGADSDPRALFICPACAGRRWQVDENEMHCLDCNTRWEIDDGIYDLKTPHHT
jgi:SAM-dependent methyltransferase